MSAEAVIERARRARAQALDGMLAERLKEACSTEEMLERFLRLSGLNVIERAEWARIGRAPSEKVG